MSNQNWTPSNSPDLKGKIAIVTGANSGLGLETATWLMRKGAHTILACRNQEKGSAVMKDLLAKFPDKSVELMSLDLASLKSVKTFSQKLLDKHPSIDLLINNAGVMALPYRLTEDGFEMQFGTNHLGHFALTGHLLDAIRDGGRIVTVSSNVHRQGKMNFDDLKWTSNYKRWSAYGMSKLANLLFTYELARRLKASGSNVLSLAAHPGYSSTNLHRAGPQLDGSTVMEAIMGWSATLFAQNQENGALPTLYAAMAETVSNADYYGPSGFLQLWGSPTKVESNQASHNVEDAAQLWEMSETLTGISYLSSPHP